MELERTLVQAEEARRNSERVSDSANSQLSELQNTLLDCQGRLSQAIHDKHAVELRCQSLVEELQLLEISRHQLQLTMENLQLSIAAERKQSIERSLSNRVHLETMLEQSSKEVDSLKSLLREANGQIGNLTDAVRSKETLLEQRQKQLTSAQLNNDVLSNIERELHTNLDSLKVELSAKNDFINSVKDLLKNVILQNNISCNFENISLDNEIILVYIDSISRAICHYHEEARSARSYFAKTQTLQSELTSLRTQLNHDNNSHIQSIVRVENRVGFKEHDDRFNHLLNQVKVLQESLRIESTAKNSALDEIKLLKKSVEELSNRQAVTFQVCGSECFNVNINQACLL